VQLVLEQYLDEGLVSISSTHVIEGASVDSECKKVAALPLTHDCTIHHIHH
jgi:hypothetical protein